MVKFLSPKSKVRVPNSWACPCWLRVWFMYLYYSTTYIYCIYFEFGLCFFLVFIKNEWIWMHHWINRGSRMILSNLWCSFLANSRSSTEIILHCIFTSSLIRVFCSKKSWSSFKAGFFFFDWCQGFWLSFLKLIFF